MGPTQSPTKMGTGDKEPREWTVLPTGTIRSLGDEQCYQLAQ